MNSIDLLELSLNYGPISLPNPHLGPIGHYMAYIIPDCSVIATNKRGMRCIKWSLELCGPKHIGLLERKCSMLEGPGLSYTKGELKLLGFEVRTMTDIKKAVSELRGQIMNVHIIEDKNLLTTREYRNVQFESFITVEELAELENKFYIPDVYLHRLRR